MSELKKGKLCTEIALYGHLIKLDVLINLLKGGLKK